jgi:hypothetical protein
MTICWLVAVPFFEESYGRSQSLIFRADRACGALHPETLVARALPSSVERADGCGSSARRCMIVWHMRGVLAGAYRGGVGLLPFGRPLL